jgi:hypothetical protein
MTTDTVYTTPALVVGDSVRITEASGLQTERVLVGTLVEVASPDEARVLGGVPHPYRVALPRPHSVPAEALASGVAPVVEEEDPLGDPHPVVAEILETALVDLDVSALAPRDEVLTVLRRSVPEHGLRAGDSVEVRSCGSADGCLVALDDDTTTYLGLHLETCDVGVPRDTADAIRFGIVEDPALLVGVLRERLRDEGSLRRQAATLVRRREEEAESLRGDVKRWRSEVEQIADRLKEHAEDQTFCGEWDSGVREFASGLTFSGEILAARATRTRRYLVDVEVRTTVCVPVEAEDEDDAREQASGLWSEYAYGEEISTDRLSETDSSSWSVEEDPDAP